MTNQQKSYYYEMLEKGRLFPFIRNGRLICFITYYISDNLNEFINNPWGIYQDNEYGKTCYICQLLTDKEHKENARLSYEIWHNFKDYIKNNYLNVEKIIWRRWNWKKGEVDVHVKTIK